MPYFPVLYVCIDLVSILALNSHSAEWTPICAPLFPSVMLDITEPLVNLPYTCFGVIPRNVALLLHDVLSQR